MTLTPTQEALLAVIVGFDETYDHLTEKARAVIKSALETAFADSIKGAVEFPRTVLVQALAATFNDKTYTAETMLATMRAQGWNL